MVRPPRSPASCSPSCPPPPARSAALGDRPRARRADAPRRSELRRARRRPRLRATRSTRCAPDTPRMPASVQKLYTSATTLRRLGASGRLEHHGARRGRARRRRRRATATSTCAAAATRRSTCSTPTGSPSRSPTPGVVEVTGRVIGDETAFDTRRGVPSSAFRLTSEVGPLSALTFNRGRTGRRAPYWQNRPGELRRDRSSPSSCAHLGVDVARGARRGRTPDGRRPARRLALAAGHRPAAA